MGRRPPSLSNPRSRAGVTPEEAVRIKELLWISGSTQETVRLQIHEEFGRMLNQSTISRIKSGQIAHNVPWPDGHVGAMGKNYLGRNPEQDWSPSASAYTTWPPLAREAMLRRVNDYRKEDGLAPLPPIDPVYAEYLTGDLQLDEERELLRYQAARHAEDQRRATIMETFDLIVAVKAAERTDDAYLSIVQQGRLIESGPDVEQHTPITEWHAVKLHEVIDFAPQLVANTKDPVQIEAVKIALFDTPASEWGKKWMRRRIAEIRRFIEDQPEMLTSLKEKYSKQKEE